jgi:hypothetical protein
MTDQKVMDEFTEVGHRPYDKQAQFFLNAFWTEAGSDAEKIWEYTHGFIGLDTKKEEGCDLDEFYSHKFLENFGETMTALELRNKLRTIDINNDHHMSLLEYLLNRFSQDVETLMSRPQGTNEELEKAQKALDDVQKEIKRIETTKADLETRAAAGGVKGNTAKQELFKLLNEDPTELNRAVLTAEAAVRRAQKLEIQVAPGQTWWLGRQLEEAKKYKPKGGVKPIA